MDVSTKKVSLILILLIRIVPFPIIICMMKYLMETQLASGKGQEVWQKGGFLEGWEVLRMGFSGGLILA